MPDATGIGAEQKQEEINARALMRDEVELLLAGMQVVLDRVITRQFNFRRSVMSLMAAARQVRASAAAQSCQTTGLVAQRLTEYLADLVTPNHRTSSDLQTFLDTLHSVVFMPEEPDADQAAQIMRALPVHHSFDVADIEIRNVEVLLVTPSKAIAKLAGAELAACGFRVVVAHDPIEAFGIAMRSRPDFVLTSVHMDKLTGVELVNALKATKALRDLPMAVMSSEENRYEEIKKQLPAGVNIVRSGKHFAESFAVTAAQSNLG